MSDTENASGAQVPCISLLGGPHRCGTCAKEFPTCDAEKIVWGIDRDPFARGADADKVLECDAYTPNETMKRPTEKQARRLVETIRRANSSESAYQHMLDTIADDIEATFGPIMREIADFVRQWTPGTKGD